MNDHRTSSPRRWPIVAMGAGLFLLGLITRLFFNFGNGLPEPLALIPYFSVAVSQLILLAIWCGLGKTIIPVRIVGALLGMSVAWLVSFYDIMDQWLNFPGMEAIFVTYFGIMIPLLTTAITLRIVGAFRWRLGHFSAMSDMAAPTLQFGLRQLFIATTLAAVLLMGARGMRSFYATQSYTEAWRIFVFSFVLAVGYPLIAVTTVAAGLAARHLGLRMAIVAITAGTVAAFPLLIVPFDKTGGTVYVATTLIGTMIMLAALGVVRACGYRIVNR